VVVVQELAQYVLMSTPSSSSSRGFDHGAEARRSPTRSSSSGSTSIIGGFFTALAKYIIVPFVASGSVTLGVGVGMNNDLPTR
jgi:hypothetical protein